MYIHKAYPNYIHVIVKICYIGNMQSLLQIATNKVQKELFNRETIFFSFLEKITQKTLPNSSICSSQVSCGILL